MAKGGAQEVLGIKAEYSNLWEGNEGGWPVVCLAAKR